MMRTWTIASLCLLASGLPAHAACALGNLAGKWSVYTLSSDGPTAITTACDINVTRLGRASGDCVDSFGGTGKLTATFKVADAGRCAFSGTFTQFGDSYVLDRFTLSRDRALISGVGSSDTSVFLVNAVKQ